MLWTGGLSCFNCGHTRVLRNEVIDVAGEMVEIGMTRRNPEKYTADYKLQFTRSCWAMRKTAATTQAGPITHKREPQSLRKQ